MKIIKLLLWTMWKALKCTVNLVSGFSLFFTLSQFCLNRSMCQTHVPDDNSTFITFLVCWLNNIFYFFYFGVFTSREKTDICSNSLHTLENKVSSKNVRIEKAIKNIPYLEGWRYTIFQSFSLKSEIMLEN